MSRVYFTDRDLGNTFPDILAAAGLRVERHRDHFRPDCPDEEWLAAIGGKGWIAVTHDARIRATAPRIEAFLNHHAPPLIAKVYRASRSDLGKEVGAPGTVSLWYPRR